MLTKSIFTAMVSIALAMLATPSQATTVSFGGPNVDPYIENGFSIDVARIVNGDCSAKPCMALNTNETSILTRVGGGLFSLNSFWFQLLGNSAALTVTAFNGLTQVEQFLLPSRIFSHNNGGQVYSHLFANVTSVSFDNSGKGNVRIDDLNLITPSAGDPPPSAVPLPAALPLLMTSLVGLGVLGHRRNKTRPTQRV